MKKNLLKSVLLALMVLVGGYAWAADKTVVKYSFDNATSPELTAGSRVSFDYDKTSVITSTKFLNAWNNANGDPGASTVSLGSTDLSGETWTLSFEWAAVGGCNKKPDHTILKAGDTNLFDLSGDSNWNTTVTVTYTGSDGSKTLPVPGCNKSYRFSAAVGNQLNTTDYWHHFVITGGADGVKMTITNSSTGAAVVEDVVLSETNVNPTSLILEPCCGGAIGIDELSLTYFVEGEVIQTPVAAYTAVNGIERTITATCETEGATLYYSTDGENWTEGASITVSESGNVYFKAVKGNSESDVLTFAAVAGEAIILNAPAIVRSDNTTVTISADQTNLLLSPTATITYEYGNEKGSFTGSKTLTVAADAIITAYAEATGYTTSATSERAVALFPEYVNTIESTPAKTSGWSSNAFSEETKTVSERTYAALLLDEAQWGSNVYFQTDGAWGFRASGNWYINSDTQESWILMPDMKKGDIIVVNVTYPASSTVNATFSKYSFGTQHAYEVTEDGDVEIAVKKLNASTMDYLYGVYAYRQMNDDEIAAVKAFEAAVDELQAAINAAKAITFKETTTGTDPETGDPIEIVTYLPGGKDLEAAIAAAEAALTDKNATTESLTAAKAALAEAVKAFENANKPAMPEIANADFSESTPIDNHLCGYGKDMAGNGTTYYGLLDVTGWNKVVLDGDNATADYPNSGMGGAVFAYGSEWKMMGNQKTAPAAGPNGEAGNALGFFAVWGKGGYYAQDITLPAGKYTMFIPIYNQSGTQANESYTGFFVSDEVKYTVAINTAVGKWTIQSVEFELAEETAGQIRLGYKSTGSGSGANPMIFIDGVTIMSELDGAIAAYNIALAAANEAAANEVVTGEEKTALNAAIAANSDIDMTSVEAVKAATAALNAAVETLNAAIPAYQALIDFKNLVNFEAWPYASAEKKAAAEAAMRENPTSATDATTKISIYRAFVESNALAEGVEGAEVIASAIQNPRAEADTNGWTATGNGSIGIKDGTAGKEEPWTDAEGNSAYKYFDGGNWGANAWDVNFAQDITLGAGKYVLSAIMRASTNVDMKLFAGTDSVKAEVVGSAGNVFNRGWNYSFVEFDVAAEGTVNIGARGITNNSHEWMSFSDFRLVRIEKYEEPFTAEYGTLWKEGDPTKQTGDEEPFTYIELENKYFKGLAKEGDTIRVSYSSVGNQANGTRPLVITTGELNLLIDNAGGHADIQQSTSSYDFVLDADEIANIEAENGAKVVLTWRYLEVVKVELIEKQPEPVVEEEELTDLVVNGTFDTPGVIAPWKSTGGFQNQTTATNQQGAFTVPFFENWNGSAKVNKMYQVIENIPNGKYKLRIAAFVNTLADPNESQFVFANADKTYLTTGEPTAYEVTTVVTDNRIEIGLEQTTATANWMGIDNVSLSYIGPKNQFIKELAKMNLEPKQSVKTKDALQIAYEAFIADETDENKEALKTAIAAAKVSVNSYKILEAGVLPDNSLEGWTCTNNNTFHINTWSVEGNSDGSNMVTPFIENWVWKGDNGDVVLGTGEIYYSLPGLDPGIYQFSALIRAYSEGGNAPTGASLFAGNREKEFATGKNFEYNGMKGIYDTYAMTCEVGEDGVFRFGVKISEEVNFNWMAFKNCKVAYVGAAIDEAAVNELAATMPEGKMNADVKNAAEAAIATAKATPNLDNYEAAAKAIAAAEASVAAYAKMKKALDDMAAVLENTNVYTAEAYKANFTDQLEAYEAGTVLDADAAAFTMGSRLTGPLPSILLSAWSSAVEGVPYINTWSVEGNNDGTNFLTPFFEYWVADGESLAANTLTAKMTDLQKGIYDVTAWVRVRMKNGAEAPANGIFLQVNESTGVSVVGAQLGESQFYLNEMSVQGEVTSDGELNIKFNVAEDNNISWLSFKNVKFAFNKELTDGITNVNVNNQPETIYNLNGQKVEKAKKGLYIINGKKVVKK